MMPVVVLVKPLSSSDWTVTDPGDQGRAGLSPLAKSATAGSLEL